MTLHGSAMNTAHSPCRSSLNYSFRQWICIALRPSTAPRARPWKNVFAGWDSARALDSPHTQESVCTWANVYRHLLYMTRSHPKSTSPFLIESVCLLQIFNNCHLCARQHPHFPPFSSPHRLQVIRIDCMRLLLLIWMEWSEKRKINCKFLSGIKKKAASPHPPHYHAAGRACLKILIQATLNAVKEWSLLFEETIACLWYISWLKRFQRRFEISKTSVWFQPNL